MLEDIHNIANYFIWFASEHGDLLNHLKLQQLCFLAEAFHIVHKNKPLTGGTFEAWPSGAFSKKLWERFKKYSYKPVNTDIPPICGSGENGDYVYPKPKISKKVESHLRKIIHNCWGLSSWALQYAIHEHDPWRDARKGYAPLEHCDKEIDKNDIKEFYTYYVKKHKMEEFYPKGD